MRKTKKSLLLLSLGVAAMSLAGCDWKFWNIFKKDTNEEKAPLVIPNVDVESLKVNLPSLPTRNVGQIRSDSEFEYIDLYELSDFHGAVNFEAHSNGNYVGLEGLGSYFDDRRAENPGGTLILSSGDMFQGSADSNLTRGFMVNYAMQYIGFDAMAVGNHEFDWSDAWLKKNAELEYNTSSVPFLGCNILKNNVMPDFLKKSTVVTRGNYKIGVIGAIGASLENSILKSAIAEYEFVEYANIVSTEAHRLKTEESCNAVVLLVHDAVDKLETVSGVDAAFGGHAHKDDYSYALGFPARATKNYGQSVARISLKFNKANKQLVDTSDDLYSFTSADNKSHSEIKKIMDEYAPSINQIKNIKLGTCDETLKFDRALKNICTSSVFEAAVDAVKDVSTIDGNKIVAAFHNVNGGIRDDIKAGDITYGNVYRSFPFDNEVVLIKVTGQEIKDRYSALRQYGTYRVFEKSSYFTNSEEYYIATTDYLALTNDFSSFKYVEEADLIRTGKIVRDEVANKIYNIDTLKNRDLEFNGDYHYQMIPAIF